MKKNQNKLGRYTSPTVLQVAEVTLERNFLQASPEDKPIDTYVIETTGQQVDGVFDYSTDNTFNHQWGN